MRAQRSADILSDSADQTAAETFRRLGSPRRRASDIAIGTSAVAHTAILWTLNRDDFADVPDIELGP